MKPLMSPQPRRRDRPSGDRTAHLRETLRQPAGPRRSGAAKRRALGRLLARYESRGRPVLISVAALVCLVVLSVLVAREFGGSADPVAYPSQPERYEQLAAAMRRACGNGSCWFGWSNSVRPPADVQRPMSQLRVRDAGCDARDERCWFLGWHDASFYLVSQAPGPGTPPARRAQADRAFAERYRSYDGRPAEWVGEGWLRAPGRLGPYHRRLATAPPE